MIHILQSQLFRLKKSKLFWAMFGVVAALPLLGIALNVLRAELLQSVDLGIEVDGWEFIRQTATMGELSSVAGSMADHSLFALICTSIFLCGEFSEGTFRNMIIANRSRREIYLSMLSVAVGIGAVYLGVNLASTILFNGAIFGFGTMSAANVITACFVALAMGLITVIFVQSMMCMFMFGTRKLAVALTCPLIICMVAPMLVTGFVQVGVEFGSISPTDMSWIPLYNMTMLDLTVIDGALIGKILLYIVPFAVLFGCMGWVTFRKADLK